MEIQGEIQKISSDRKTIKISGNIYRFFNELSNDFGNGNIVNVRYSERKVGDKVFKNINSITKVIENKDSFKEENKEIPRLKISDTTINCLIMQSVIHSENKKISLKEAANEVTQAYKSIISSL
jgi:hypothetical protein